MSEPTALRFAVITDAHFHPPGAPVQAAYGSDASFNARNEAIVHRVNRARPDFVVHLGDIPHPVPGLPEHAQALAEAKRIYAGLDAPLHVVPGNHDVGDKPHPLSPAPRTGPELHAVFERTWGPPWWSFDLRDCRFVGIDTPVLNTGLPLESAQWSWLEDVLSSAGGRRIFVFAHYPLFLDRPDEAEHYDNLAEPARSRLLARFADHGVQAVFTGHVHHFFFHRHRGVELLTAPSTTFVRPGYAELCRVEPGREYGRDDRGRLGFLLVDVDAESHRYVPVRSAGRLGLPAPVAEDTDAAPHCPLGVTLRYPWASAVDIPAGNLDPFVRKRVHNDLFTWAPWDLGLGWLRLPIADLLDDHAAERLEGLARQGASLVFFAAGMPDAATWERILARRERVAALELILPRPIAPAALAAVPPEAPEIWLSVVGGRTQHSAAYFSHFPKPGFDADDQGLADLPERVAGVTHLVAEDASPWEAVSRIVARASGRRACCLIRLPRGGEGALFEDDAALARRVAEAWCAAVAHPEATVILDGFVDHDRGYHPRIGLVDRRMDPRPAYEVLRALAHAGVGPPSIRPMRLGEDRAFELCAMTGTVLRLPAGGMPALERGEVGEASPGGSRGGSVRTSS